MSDFNLNIYKRLIQSLESKEYIFQTMQMSIDNPLEKCIVLRHDVDRKPDNSLRMAKLENKFGIKATYYFRTILQTFKPEIIREISKLGHEIGYHYESLAETNGNYELAIKDFETNLEKLREIVQIKNIAMHGRPTSKWDSRKLWEKYDYKSYEIVSEPYFDISFNEVQYITDAGRTWDNARVNLRDKVDSPFNNNFKHTEDILKALNMNKLSNQIMFNIHPEHWADSAVEWWKIWLIRKVKNKIKKIVVRKAKKN
jgi:hypothetical protein